MKEIDYINVKHLAHLLDIKRILSDITPEMSNLIKVDNYGNVVEMIDNWVDRHFKNINCECNE